MSVKLRAPAATFTAPLRLDRSTQPCPGCNVARFMGMLLASVSLKCTVISVPLCTTGTRRFPLPYTACTLPKSNVSSSIAARNFRLKNLTLILFSKSLLNPWEYMVPFGSRTPMKTSLTPEEIINSAQHSTVWSSCRSTQGSRVVYIVEPLSSSRVNFSIATRSACFHLISPR